MNIGSDEYIKIEIEHGFLLDYFPRSESIKMWGITALLALKFQCAVPSCPLLTIRL